MATGCPHQRIPSESALGHLAFAFLSLNFKHLKVTSRREAVFPHTSPTASSTYLLTGSSLEIGLGLCQMSSSSISLGGCGCHSPYGSPARADRSRVSRNLRHSSQLYLLAAHRQRDVRDIGPVPKILSIENSFFCP